MRQLPPTYGVVDCRRTGAGVPAGARLQGGSVIWTATRQCEDEPRNTRK